ncbi:MAG TPA: hypothetical protein VK669_10135 [Candidatus Limnocylindrales bacterium]|nr:hypothetical protein [Candidatus Limnocylindrales bacterium]
MFHIVVPRLGERVRQFAIESVSQRNLEDADRPEESCRRCGIPDVQLDRSFEVACDGVPICVEPVRAQRRFDVGSQLRCVDEHEVMPS